MIPYTRQHIDEDDIAAVIEVLSSNWVTTGPKVPEFENAFARFVSSNYAVAVSSGTAALHSAMFAINIKPGDEVIVPALTFAASANCIIFQGGNPVFADVDPDTLLIDPQSVESKITAKTKAIIAVDYAGQACNYDKLRQLSDKYKVFLIADACHSLGGEYKGSPVGCLADLNVFSFHPAKHITTGEGGMVTTDVIEFAERMRRFRNHGISTGFREREKLNSWFYEMVDLGFNYRLTDIQCALGITQLNKLPESLKKRRELAEYYDENLSKISGIDILKKGYDILHAYHLYVIKVNESRYGMNRDELFSKMRSSGVGVNVHYIPVHLHPYYIENFRTYRGLCPVAEAEYFKILSLPMFPDLTKPEQDHIIAILAGQK